MAAGGGSTAGTAIRPRPLVGRSQPGRNVGTSTRIVGQGTRHKRTKPYTPRHNGKVERYQRIMAEEVLYARRFTSEDARSAAIAVWNSHYNSHRPHGATAGKPPAARLRESVTNVEPSYS